MFGDWLRFARLLLSGPIVVVAASGLMPGALEAQFQAYVLDSAQSRDLMGLEPLTGQTSLLGSTANNGLDFPLGLDWRADRGELWVIDYMDGDIGTLASATGQFARFATIGLDRWTGMTWDPSTQRFYLAKDHPSGQVYVGRLYSFDPATSSTTLIGQLPARVQSMDIDPQGELWALGGTGLYRVNKATATGTRVSQPPASSAYLGVHPDSGRFHVAHRTAPGSFALSEIDPLTGQVVRSVGLLGISGLNGFTFVYGLCPGQPGGYGSGCAGSGDFRPSLNLLGCIGPGQSARLELSEVLTGSTAFAFFGAAPGQVPLGDGCDLLVTPLFAAPILPIVIFGSGGPGRGFGILDVAIPLEVAIAPFAVQALVLDRGVARGYALSNGVRVEVRP